MPGLTPYLEVGRTRLAAADREHVRLVHQTAIVRRPQDREPFEGFMTGRLPFFYRDPDSVGSAFTNADDFRRPIRETLLRLPTSTSFRESHFGEILAGVFATEVLNLRLLYSKLTLLTAENANPYKMDLVLYDPTTEPVEFVFGEVKTSPKCEAPAKHDTGCYADLFRSFGGYAAEDREFDLATVNDRLNHMDAADAARVRAALRLGEDVIVRYAGFCVIDAVTRDDGEAQILGTRSNAKVFDVDVVSVQELAEVTAETYASLDRLRSLVQPL